MTTSKKFLMLLAVLVLILVGIGVYYKMTFIPCAFPEECYPDSSQEQNENASLANPASVYCIDQGGQLVMKEKPDGGQYALCYFDDNRACEEWAMYRGECPVGGMKTTGYDTEAQRFCGWSGGHTTATENAVCVLPDGRECLVDDFYLGDCAE